MTYSVQQTVACTTQPTHRSNPTQGASCGTSDLRAYGVVADGVTDDAPFLENASATATAPGLYLERAKGSTELTIKSDVTLT